MRNSSSMRGCDLPWLRRTFESHFPVVELCTIIIPTIMFGMFTMGLNPEDSALRTGYYLVITVTMPASMLAGYLLALIPARNVVLIFLDVATGFVAFLSYLWFQARFSIVPTEVSSTFPGWQWQSHYQQDVLCALVVIVSCRSGMSFPRRGGKVSETRNSSVVPAIAFSLILVASTYIICWLFGTWWLLHLSVACFAFIGGSIQFLFPDQKSMSDDHPPVTEAKGIAWKPILLGIGIPLLMLGQGFSIGLSFVANSWSAGWLFSIGITLLLASIVTCLVLAVESGIRMKVEPSWLLLGAAGLLLGVIAMLMLRVLLPSEIGWSALSGVPAGLVAVALSRLAVNGRHPFRATLYLLLVMFCSLIGIGGGIAYYLYAPYGDDLIIWIVLGAVVYAAAVIGHVPIIMHIKKAFTHTVKASS